MNDKLEFKIPSIESSDSNIFTISIIYKGAIVGNKDFYFNQFTFKIWEIFNEFTSDNTDAIIRVTYYNLKYQK